MTSKDEALTYEELTALCRRQEEYIKELKKKIENMTPCDDEKCCMPAKPSYEELEFENKKLSTEIMQYQFLVKALEDSLMLIKWKETKQ